MEKKIYVRGGRTLSGETKVDGSKNSALACLVVAALSEEQITLDNVPRTSDIDIMIQILKNAGKEISFFNNSVVMKGSIKNVLLNQELASKIRASIYCLGLFLATNKKALIPLPGGDKIGNRPIDIHLDCMHDLGVEYEMKSGVVNAERNDKIKENVIFLRYPSVGATCNLLILSSMIEEKIVIKNAAKEPEIVDVANLLHSMGVMITGAGSDTITIIGKRKLLGNFSYEIMPDRIETGIIITAIAVAGGECRINNAIPEHNLALINTYKKAGLEIIEDVADSIFVRAKKTYKPINAIALPYPGMPTDLQPLLSVFAQRCEGESIIKDTVFPERFGYVNELNKLGAEITHYGNTIKVIGTKELSGAYLEGDDIRAVTTLLCAALIPQNDTVISGLYHLNRGYPDFCEILKNLGADIIVK